MVVLFNGGDIVIRMNDSHNSPINFAQQPKSKSKIVTGSIIAVVIALAVGYFFVAFAVKAWPFSNVTQTSGNTPPSAEKNSPDIALAKPVIRTIATQETMMVNAKVDTKETGDCVLTLSSRSRSYEFKSTSKGTKGSGCFSWNINASSLEKGTYVTSVKFTSVSGKTSSSPEQTVTVE
jgi:hypothetical protein